MKSTSALRSAIHTLRSLGKGIRTHSTLIFVVMAIALLGMTATLSSGVSDSPDSGDNIVLSPTQHLFCGDSVRIWPHLGWIAAGCVEVDPVNRPTLVRTICHVWENGVKKSELPGPGVVIKRSGPEQDHGNLCKWAASISLQPVPARDDGASRVEIHMVLQNGHSTIATAKPTVITVPPACGASGAQSITESVLAHPSNTYPVWQFAALPAANSVLRTGTIGQLTDCAWGVVMEIQVENASDD